MDSTLKTWIDAPATGLSPYVAEERATTAPVPAAQGTGVSVAGTCVEHASVVSAHLMLAPLPVADAAFVAAEVRTTDLPGPVPRGAPV